MVFQHKWSSGKRENQVHIDNFDRRLIQAIQYAAIRPRNARRLGHGSGTCAITVKRRKLRVAGQLAPGTNFSALPDLRWWLDVRPRVCLHLCGTALPRLRSAFAKGRVHSEFANVTVAAAKFG
jgi:hypothetical protein